MTKRTLTLFVTAMCLTWPVAAFSDEINGIPRVIDGDTVELAGERIRLDGIDAPETKQTCTSRKGKIAQCGRLQPQLIKIPSSHILSTQCIGHFFEAFFISSALLGHVKTVNEWDRSVYAEAVQYSYS